MTDTHMLVAPTHFRGSWMDLYRSHIEPNLPQVDAVIEFHEWMIRYCEDPNSVFPLRAVRGTERRKVYRTSDGTLIAPADNSPAWVVHAFLMARKLLCYRDFAKLMATMPTHMFDISRHVNRTANHFGWYIAHIYPAKNRDINFNHWRRCEVERRFFLTLHPCNLFLVPGVRNNRHGEDPQVIAFIAAQYSARYSPIWHGFLQRIMAEPLFADPGFGSRELILERMTPDVRSRVPEWDRDATAPVCVSYRATRLTNVQKRSDRAPCA